MKLFRKCFCLAAAAALAVSAAGCSASNVTEVFDDLVEDTAADALPETPAPRTSITDPKAIDTSIAEPEFDKNLKGSVTIAKGENYILEVSASSPDGGVITYQWYKNNVDSNGGGTIINGATSSIFTVSASDVGSVFYYVVAVNNHDKSCNMSTSNTFEVTTVKDGEWVQDEFGKKYVNSDGTYPVECWIIIGGDTYHFDSEGYISVGWLGVGKHFYYFQEDGKLLKNGTTPDGYQTDEKGRMIGNGAPELSPSTAEIAQAAREAAEAAALAAEEEAARAAAEAAAQSEAQPEESYEEPGYDESGESFEESGENYEEEGEYTE